jgi:hypothetical protein
VGELDGWKSALAEAGIGAERGDGPHLVVTTPDGCSGALAGGADFVIVVGRGRKRKRPAGWFARRYLPVPSEGPTLWLPLDAPEASRYALYRWLAPPTRVKRLRNRAVVSLLRTPGSASLPAVEVMARTDPVPWFVTAATEKLYGGRPTSWLTTTASGQDYRGVFHLFESGTREPSWIVKFARGEHLGEPFDRDRRGLALAAAAGGIVSDHVPLFVSALEAEGLRASIETAAVGERLSTWLQSSKSTNVKRAAIERIAAWIVEISLQTAAPGALDTEKDRLAREVVPLWEPFGAPPNLVDQIPSVAGVLQHNDLWTENVIEDRGDFRVIDWEDARRDGLPLWDLAYFLADALARIDGAIDDAARKSHFVSLFRGELPASELLFRWIRRAAVAAHVPEPAVGPILTAGWMSLVLSHVTRGADAARFQRHGLTQLPPGEFWASLWLADEGLGVNWSAWRR